MSYAHTVHELIKRRATDTQRTGAEYTAQISALTLEWAQARKAADQAVTRELCRRLEIARRKIGINYTDLSIAADMQPSVAFAVCTGKPRTSPKFLTIVRLAQALGLSLDALMEGL